MPTFQLDVYYVSHNTSVDIGPFADAMLLIHSDPALDAALNVAHDVIAKDHPHHIRRRLLKNQADDIRSHLRRLEDQMEQETEV